MPDKNLQITGVTGGARNGAGQFCKGRSGNPAGRPRGAVGSAARVAGLLLDGEAEALARKAVEMALSGDPVALRFCLARILGTRRGRPADLDLPPVATAADMAGAMTAIVAAATQGSITPDEAVALSQTVESFTRILEAVREERAYNWRQGVREGSKKPAAE